MISNVPYFVLRLTQGGWTTQTAACSLAERAVTSWSTIPNAIPQTLLYFPVVFFSVACNLPLSRTQSVAIGDKVSSIISCYLHDTAIIKFTSTSAVETQMKSGPRLVSCAQPKSTTYQDSNHLKAC